MISGQLSNLCYVF